MGPSIIAAATTTTLTAGIVVGLLGINAVLTRSATPTARAGLFLALFAGALVSPLAVA